MRIEAVTVCVDYADLLSLMAPHNLPHLDRWVVVTSPADKATQAACRRFHLECVQTNDFFAAANEFHKARGINRGLALLRQDDWVLHLDADVALPADFRPLLRDAALDPTCLHGCDRLNVTGLDAWQRVAARGLWCRRNPWAVHLQRADCRLGTRVANLDHGYTPIGFFQLWHGPSAPSKNYPLHHGSCARTDVQHALQWDRNNRVLVPELLVWHLDTERAAMGANWRGRTTKPLSSPAKESLAAATEQY